MSRSRLSTPSFAVVLLLALVAVDRAAAQTTERISVSSAGVQGDGGSLHAASITPDGRFVAFQSDSTNLVAGDTNFWRDIFVRDREAGTTTRVSVSTTGAESNGFSFNPSISADGRFVAFESHATNLVAGDSNANSDVFLHDRATGVTTRRSVSSTGIQGNLGSWLPAISADGQWLTFTSQATTLVPLASNTLNHVFLHERATGVTTLVGVAFAGGLESGQSFESTLSADGRFIAFTSDSSNLLAGPIGGLLNIFVRDRVLGTTVRASVQATGSDVNGYSFHARISANGRVVAFQSDAGNLVAGDNNFLTDVFVRDLDLGVTERVSVSSAGGDPNGGSGGTGQPPGLSSDGRYVTFSSWASNLVPGAFGWTAIYLRDRALGQNSFVSVSTGGAQATNTSLQPTMSSDGRFVVFTSVADNLVPGDTNFNYDIFVRGPLATPWTNLGFGLAGTNGVPNLLGSGTLVAGSPGSVSLSSARASSPAVLFLSFSSAPAIVKCGTLVPVPPAAVAAFVTDSLGALPIGWATFPAGLSGLSMYFQYAIPDAAAVCGVAFSNALRGDAQ